MKNLITALVFLLPALFVGCVSTKEIIPPHVKIVKPRYATLMDNCIEKYINNGIKSKEAIEICQSAYGSR